MERPQTTADPDEIDNLYDKDGNSRIEAGFIFTDRENEPTRAFVVLESEIAKDSTDHKQTLMIKGVEILNEMVITTNCRYHSSVFFKLFMHCVFRSTFPKS